MTLQCIFKTNQLCILLSLLEFQGRNSLCQNQKWHLKSQAIARTPPCGAWSHAVNPTGLGPHFKKTLHSNSDARPVRHGDKMLRRQQKAATGLNSFRLQDLITWMWSRVEQWMWWRIHFRLGSQLECPLRVHHWECNTHRIWTSCAVTVDNNIFWVWEGLLGAAKQNYSNVNTSSRYSCTNYRYNTEVKYFEPQCKQMLPNISKVS